jgi:hypothetical protein
VQTLLQIREQKPVIVRFAFRKADIRQFSNDVRLGPLRT